MTDEREPRSSAEPAPANLDGDVARLVRLAGPRPTMPASRVERMQAELRPVWDAEVDRARGDRPALRLLALAALLAVAIGAVFFVRTALGPHAAVIADVARVTGTVTAWSAERPGSVETVAAGTELTAERSLATDEDGRVALEMASGHSLRLDHGTRIAFLSEREIRLDQGAIYVDSGAAGLPPLDVVTAIGRVEEIGTQFEVRLNGGGMTVRIREGEVALDVDGESHRGRAGEQLVLSGGTVRRTPIAPTDPVFDWTQSIAPSWPLDGSRLDDFLSWVERESGYDLDYSAGSTVVLSGDVEGLAPLAALDVVLPAVGLTHRVEDGTLVIEPVER